MTIQASSGLSEEEIQRMVKDAEANAEEDRKLHELVSAKNQGESLVHSVKKSLVDFGDKVAAEEKTAIEAALAEAEAALKGEDKEVIDAKVEALMQVSHKLAEQMYAAQGAEGTHEAAQEAPGAASAKKDEGDVVDAEFEEVKDKK